jgi:ParB family chromosome partitioning protein
MVDEPEEDEGLRPIPDRLMIELTAARTLALRLAVGENSDVAFNLALHALCLRVFYRYAQESCLELDLKLTVPSAPGLADSAAAIALDERHRGFADRLPDDPGELWAAIVALDRHIRAELFAHCVAQGVNAVVEPWNRRPRAIAQADQIATAVSLDMGTHWTPTADSYFGRVTKARILQAVRETCGDGDAARIADLKKAEMAERAEELLAGSGWLPEPLRTEGVYPEPDRAPYQPHQPGDETEAVANATAIPEPGQFDDTVDLPADAVAEAAE